MKDLPGVSLIAKEIGIDCMKITIKLTKKLPIMRHKPYIYHVREAEAVILEQLPDKEISRISQHMDTVNVGLRAEEKISGRTILLCSDKAITEVQVGTHQTVSGRHKRQYARMKSYEKCIAFVITTWGQENIEPPEPTGYITMLCSL